MMISALSIWWVLLWAIFATVFYRIRYKDVKWFKNPWTMIAIFAANFFFFAYAALLFVIVEWFRWSSKKTND